MIKILASLYKVLSLFQTQCQVLSINHFLLSPQLCDLGAIISFNLQMKESNQVTCLRSHSLWFDGNVDKPCLSSDPLPCPSSPVWHKGPFTPFTRNSRSCTGTLGFLGLHHFRADTAEACSPQGHILAANTQLGLNSTHPLRWAEFQAPGLTVFPALLRKQDESATGCPP